MAKRLKDYIAYISGINVQELSEEELEKIRRELLVNIQFFQHERLIHLIVTVLFAILMMFAMWGCLTIGEVAMWAFAALVFILLVPYIRHYYILENGVQKLYELYDGIAGKWRN